LLPHLIVNWILSALVLWLIARIISGFEVRDFVAALMAAAVIAVVNFLFGWFFRLLAWPLIFLTLGLFTFVINAILLKLAALFTPGFRIRGFVPALLGSLLLTVLTFVLQKVVYA
jgi:putative membrane protein